VLEPVRVPFSRIANGAAAKRLSEVVASSNGLAARDEFIADVLGNARDLAAAAADLSRGEIALDEARVVADTEATLRAVLTLLDQSSDARDTPKNVRDPNDVAMHDPASLGTLATLVAVRALGGAPIGQGALSRRRLDEWRLTPIIAQMFAELGADEARAWQLVDAVRAIVGGASWPIEPVRSVQEDARSILGTWLEDEIARRAIGLNEFEGVLWFRDESYGDLVRLWSTAELVRALESDEAPPSERMRRVGELAASLRQAAARSNYRADALLDALGPPTDARQSDQSVGDRSAGARDQAGPRDRNDAPGNPTSGDSSPER
jgi:hypothetical protein